MLNKILGNELSSMKPEADFYLNDRITIRSLIDSMNDHTLVVGRVERWDKVNHQLVVNLGNCIKGFIPLKEISLYSISFIDDYSNTISALIGNNVCCYVTAVNSTKDTCVLSRSQSMYAAWQYIERNLIDTQINGFVTYVARFGAFLDVCRGITGMVNLINLTNTQIECAADVARRNTHLRVSITGIKDDDMYKLELSHKICYGSTEENLENFNVGDITAGTLRKEISCCDPTIHKGFFVEVNPSVTGIVHIDSDQYVYGKNGKFYVSKVTDKGLVLKIINE